MELIDRYIYAVIRLLPVKQRGDIETELRGLIDDMLEQRKRGRDAGGGDIEAVLSELGEPSSLAAKYSGKPRYLIGPGIFETYTTVLKIALAASVFGMLVALAVNFAASPPQEAAKILGDVLGSIFSAAAGAFTWVTAVFALIEYHSADLNAIKLKKRGWKPSDLPEIPVKSALIRRSEPIAGILFIIIFYTLLNYAPGFFSIYHGGASPIPVFQPDVLKAYLPLINIGFAVSILKEIVRLAYGRYTLKLTAATIVLSGISFVLTVIVFSNFSIWNPDFVYSLHQTYGFSVPPGFDFTRPVLIFAKAFLGIILFAFSVETISAVIKTIRVGSYDFSRLRRSDRP